MRAVVMDQSARVNRFAAEIAVRKFRIKPSIGGDACCGEMIGMRVVRMRREQDFATLHAQHFSDCVACGESVFEAAIG